MRRQPQAYLASSEPALLRYPELYLTETNSKLEGWSWSAARQRIQVPATLDAVRAFMINVDALSTQEQQIHATIHTITEEIETLIEAIYQEAPDAQMMDIIVGKRMPAGNESLF